MIEIVRLFDPSRDSVAAVVELWNECYGTMMFTERDHFSRVNKENIIIVEDSEGHLAGFALLLDGGMPYAILDSIYLVPRERRYASFKKLFEFAEALCKDRGIKWFYGVLNQSGGETEQLIRLLAKRGEWKAQYLGEKPTFCRSTA